MRSLMTSYPPGERDVNVTDDDTAAFGVEWMGVNTPTLGL